MYDVLDVAKEIINAHYNIEGTQIMDRKKIQAYLFILQCTYLRNKKTLFIDDIIATVKGPMVERIYEEYKDLGMLDEIPPYSNWQSSISKEDRKIIKYVVEDLCRFTGEELQQGNMMKMIYKIACKKNGINSVISKEDIRKYVDCEIRDFKKLNE